MDKIERLEALAENFHQRLEVLEAYKDQLELERRNPDGSKKKDKTLDILIYIEWGGMSSEESVCPRCGMNEGDSHTIDCGLAELIKTLRSKQS